jgi:hypothetical protein
VKVPANGRCNVSSGGSAVQAAVPGAGEESPGIGANAVQHGVKYFYLAAKIFDILLRIVILGGLRYARECRLGCALNNAVCAAGCCVKVALGLAGKDGPYMGE